MHLTSFAFVLLLLIWTPPVASQQPNLWAQAQWWVACTPPSAHAQAEFQAVRAAANEASLQNVQLCQSPYVPNASATVVQGPPRPVQVMTPFGYQVAFQPSLLPVIFYNPSFFAQVDVLTNNPNVIRGILAHELGHHKLGHVDPGAPLALLSHPYQKELDADRFAGVVLARLAVPAADLDLVQRQVLSVFGSPSHPPTAARIEGMREGYVAGGGKLDGSSPPSTSAILTQVRRWY